MLALETQGIKQPTLNASDGRSITSTKIDELLDFVLESPRDGFTVAWDLNSFVTPILRLLTDSEILTLCETARLTLLPTPNKRYSLFFRLDSVFTVRRGSWSTDVYNLSRHFPAESQPKTLSDVVSLGNDLLSEMSLIGVRPTSLASGVAMIRSSLERLHIPNWRSLPDEVGDMAWRACNGGWTEAHIISHFDKVYDYDLTGGYSHHVSRLLDISNGRWLKQPERPQGAEYGFLEGQVTVTGDICPLMVRLPSGITASLKGKFHSVVLAEEVDFLREWGIGDFKLTGSAWWWVPSRRVQPLHFLIHGLHHHRKDSPTLKRLCKSAAVGVYGLFLHTKADDTLGDRFNPVYASIIEHRCALAVAKFIYENKLNDHLIHVSTDGCLVNKRITVPNNGQLGTWREDYADGPALIVSSGTIFYGDKRPSQLTYREAMALIEAVPDHDTWAAYKTRRVTPGDLALGVKLLGRTMPIETSFRLLTRAEHDRDFPRLPSSGRELLGGAFRSRPWDTKHL